MTDALMKADSNLTTLSSATRIVMVPSEGYDVSITVDGVTIQRSAKEWHRIALLHEEQQTVTIVENLSEAEKEGKIILYRPGQSDWGDI